MNILLVDQISSVTWKYTFSLANSLKEQGQNVFVVTDLNETDEFCKCKTIKVFNTAPKNISKFSKLINYIHGYKTIFRLIKKNKIDIVHFQWITFSPIDYYFIKKIKEHCKIVMTIHDIIAFDSHFYDKKYYRKIYSLPNALLIQTNENIFKFEKLFPSIDSSKIYLTYHGHYLAFADNRDQKQARETLGLPENSFVYLFFGQIKKIKGVDLLIKAFSEVKKKHNNIFLVIAGNVWHNDFKPYQELVESLGIHNNVKTNINFIPDEEIGLYFSASDIVCLPYTELFQSGVVQLSYAYKKPTIVSDLPAFLTIVEKDKSGFVFKNNDFWDLSRQMNDAFERKNDLKQMADYGYNFIKEKYSWKPIAEKIVSVYNSVMKNKEK